MDRVWAGETIGLIGAGNIATWDDPVIKRLNPLLADKLPAEPIMLGYSESNSTLSAIEIFKRALENFSPEFARAFAEANRTFALMRPALTGTAMPTGVTSDNRVSFLQVRQIAHTPLTVHTPSQTLHGPP